jgi:hypothetical protein
MTSLETFLEVDPLDAGCEHTLELLHVYVEDVLAGRVPDPRIVAHLRACTPCDEDFRALLDVSR